MEVVSFTGKSGTGKSYRANNVALDNKCDAIIDDGLLIYKGKIVAGSSAKKCESKAAAMRTALFDLEQNRKAVQSGLVQYRPERVLVLGTSDKMADWICDALGIRHASKRIYIEDVSTPEEMQLASRIRSQEGEHVIPAPIIQLKRDFAGYFINPLRLYNAAMDDNAGKSIGEVAATIGEAAAQAATTTIGEAAQAAFGLNADDVTIVRPKFSTIGNFTISDHAIRNIVSIVCEKQARCISLIRQLRQGNVSGLTIHLDICMLDSGESIEACQELQKDIKDAIESMTSFTVNRVNIRISDIAI